MKLYTKSAAVVCVIAFCLSLTSCLTAQTSGTGEGQTLNVTTPNDVRTSSDMNISPPNLTTSDPAIKMQDTLTTPVSPQR